MLVLHARGGRGGKEEGIQTGKINVKGVPTTDITVRQSLHSIFTVFEGYQ